MTISDESLRRLLQSETASLEPAPDWREHITSRVDHRRRQLTRLRWTFSGAVVAAIVAAVAVPVVVLKGETTTPGPRPLSTTTQPPPPVVSTPALNEPGPLAVGPDGSLYIDNEGTNQILRRTADGSLHIVAGNGTSGFSGDGGPAVDAELNRPVGIAFGPAGTLYIADYGNNRVRAVSPAGVITTVAGNGSTTTAGGSGHWATTVGISQPVAVAASVKGDIYIVSDLGNIERLDPSGDITTVLQGGFDAPTIPVGGEQTPVLPDAIALNGPGNLYVADFSPKLLLEFTTALRVRSLGADYVNQAGLTTAPDGRVYVANHASPSIDRVTSQGLSLVWTFRRGSFASATAFALDNVAVDRNGVIYADGGLASRGLTDEFVLIAIEPNHTIHVLDTSTVPPTAPRP